MNCLDQWCMRVQNVFINSIIMYIFSYQANILFYSKNHKEYFLLVHMKAVFKRNNSFWISINVQCSKVIWLWNSDQYHAVIFGYNAGKITIMSVINISILKCVVDMTPNTCELRKHWSHSYIFQHKSNPLPKIFTSASKSFYG